MDHATVGTTSDRELATALYTVVHQLSRLPVNAAVDKAGIAVMFDLHQLGTVRPSDLAAHMHLDLSTISRHLRALEQQGMVWRTADLADARAQRVSLTARGGEVLTQLLDNRAAAIRDSITHWPPDDRRTLSELLRRLADDLRHTSEPHTPARNETRTDERTE
ncbi:MarR family winged helix-turn-helix transcriptional regulator [Pengzhenrongella sp.]|jgi:DNA-binding MarR family transcriptional regulator|uniref:MarR family winged helix-turn-helix transcriptional regulator n=1 Tax=Pengzhenrongella sp. TaxID=2888820 RepID=UPI002F93C09C